MPSAEARKIMDVRDFHDLLVRTTLRVMRQGTEHASWQPLLPHMDPAHEEVTAWELEGPTLGIIIHFFIVEIFKEVQQRERVGLHTSEDLAMTNMASRVHRHISGFIPEARVTSVVRSMVRTLCEAKDLPRKIEVRNTHNHPLFLVDLDPRQGALFTRP